MNFINLTGYPLTSKTCIEYNCIEPDPSTMEEVFRVYDNSDYHSFQGSMDFPKITTNKVKMLVALASGFDGAIIRCVPFVSSKAKQLMGKHGISCYYCVQQEDNDYIYF